MQNFIIPSAITTIEEAKAFLTNLHTAGLAYHPEDDALDVVFNGVDEEDRPTAGDCEQFNKLMDDIYNLPGNEDYPNNLAFDPCGFLLDLFKDAEED